MLFNKLLYIGNWKALSPYVSWLKKLFFLIQLGKLKERSPNHEALPREFRH